MRLRNNAGIDYTSCYAGSLLDLDKSKLPLASNIAEVTCGRCRKLYKPIA